MTNYYFSDYVFEGDKKELDEMEAMLRRLEAMKEEDFPIKDVAWSSTWNGFVFNEFGYDPEEFETAKGSWDDLQRLNDNALSIHIKSAWFAPDDMIDLFYEKWPSLRTYYYREQPKSLIYEKHDEEGKYFPFNYILIGDVPQKDENGEDESSFVEERFNTSDEAFEWIANVLHHPVACVQDIDDWSLELQEADKGWIILIEIEGLYTLDDSSSDYLVEDGVGIIPEGATSIEDFAFNSHEDLTSIVIPDFVKEIGDNAFDSCTGLTGIYIPDSVTKIKDLAFSDCPGLTSMVVSEGNEVYDSRDNCNAIIHTESNTLVAGCKSTVIPHSVIEIGIYAFFGCTGLTGIDIPDSVMKIDWMAFRRCSGLTDIIIPDSVTEIGGCAFDECSSLTTITLPGSVKIFGEDVFDECTNLKAINVPANKIDFYKEHLPEELHSLIKPFN